jgi:hypothetical protein
VNFIGTGRIRGLYQGAILMVSVGEIGRKPEETSAYSVFEAEICIAHLQKHVRSITTGTNLLSLWLP